MRLNYFQRLLGFLALFGAAHGSISPVNSECTTHAWVRAEDLTPSTVVRGSARVKISAGCPPVKSVLLGLRLKERSFVKALLSREDRKRVKPLHPISLNFPEIVTSPWKFPLSIFDNRADEAMFYEILANKDAWIIREEERIVFETTQPIPIVEGASLDHDVVHHFSVLVPSTNFPPAQDYMNSGFAFGGSGDVEIVDVESMNEYFIRVSFVNGTTEDISAGFTGFQPLYDPTDSRGFPVSEDITLKPMQRLGHSPATNYTVQISSASDLIFTEGSEYQFVNMVITRTGPARTFSEPLTVRGCIQPTFSSKWAAEYDVSVSEPWHVPGYVLRSSLKDVEEAKQDSWKRPCLFSPTKQVSVMMPNSTADEIQSHDIVMTTSTTFTIPVKVDRRYITNFDAYYQTLTNSLLIKLATPRIVGEVVDPDDPFVTKPKPRSPPGPMFEDDEEEWIPWMKRKTPPMPQPVIMHSYSGTVPVIVRPLGDVTPSPGCLLPSTDTMSQDILSDKPGGCERPLITHYLDEGARGPIFVDRSTVPEVLAEDPAERELRAPILQPVVSSPPEGEELIYRYYHQLNPERPLIYVGETWARKVAGKGKD